MTMEGGQNLGLVGYTAPQGHYSACYDETVARIPVLRLL